MFQAEHGDLIVNARYMPHDGEEKGFGASMVAECCTVVTMEALLHRLLAESFPRPLFVEAMETALRLFPADRDGVIPQRGQRGLPAP